MVSTAHLRKQGRGERALAAEVAAKLELSWDMPIEVKLLGFALGVGATKSETLAEPSRTGQSLDGRTGFCRPAEISRGTALSLASA